MEVIMLEAEAEQDKEVQIITVVIQWVMEVLEHKAILRVKMNGTLEVVEQQVTIKELQLKEDWAAVAEVVAEQE
jgi:hypothetical protein